MQRKAFVTKVIPMIQVLRRSDVLITKVEQLWSPWKFCRGPISPARTRDQLFCIAPLVKRVEHEFGDFPDNTDLFRLFASMMLLVVSTLYVCGAQAAPQYLDSEIQRSQITNCQSSQTEYGMGVYVGYYGDPSKSQPAVGDIYYAHIVLAALGNACLGQAAYVDITLPPNTTLAIDSVHKVYCFRNNQPTAGGCPQTLKPSSRISTDPGTFAIQSPQDFWALNQDPLPTSATTTTWEFQVPLRSTKGVVNLSLKAPIRVADGNLNPTLVPSRAVTVFAADPSIEYPSPSTIFKPPTHPCTDGGQCRTDSECGPAKICICGQSVMSNAILNTRGLGGTLYFDLGDDQNYRLFSDPASIPSNMGIYTPSTNWLPFNLQPGKIYHWRGRFQASNQRTYLGVNQTFVMQNTKSLCVADPRPSTPSNLQVQ